MELPRGRLREAMLSVGAGLGDQRGLLLAGRGDPSVEPLGRQLGAVRTEPPRAPPHEHLRALAAKLTGGGRDGVRTELAATTLVRVEGRADPSVQRLLRGQR